MLEELVKNNKITVFLIVVAVLGVGLILPNLLNVPKNPTDIDNILCSTSLEPADDSEIYVDISGAVKIPGVYRMRPSSRVIDLISACGGFHDSARTDGLNLAQSLKDGDKIIVPSSARAFLSDAARLSSGKININSADQKALETIPGIGPGTAKKIIEYRSSKGIFHVPEDLKKVSGIGRSKYEKIKQYIDVY